MSCGCYEIRLQGEQFCQDCMPDKFSWLVSVDSKPDPFLMDRNHAYITPDNTVFVLDHTRSKAVPISGGGGGIDLSIYALNSDLEKKVRDLLAEIAKVKSEIKSYKAGTNIEITSDNVINNTYDDTALSERITELELRDIPVYMAGQGITIRPDKTIDAEVTLDKVNEVVTRAVADTEINLNSANLAVEDNNLVWKGTLNSGGKVNASLPLSSLNLFTLNRHVETNTPVSTTATEYNFAYLNPVPVGKLLNSYLCIRLPHNNSFTYSGVKVNKETGAIERTIKEIDNLYFKFMIPIAPIHPYIQPFEDTIRLPESDIELTISGYTSMKKDVLYLSDVEFCVTVGKALNKPKHTYMNLIGNTLNYSTSIDNNTYTLRTQLLPVVELWCITAK